MIDDAIRVRVSRKQHETEDICSFELVPADEGSLPAFSAGSHIDVHTPGGPIRQYSLCNEATESNRYLIAVLRDPSSRGGSIAMHEIVQQGHLLQISKPRNHFPLIGTAGRPLLLAGGIGVTPILCMAERLAKVGADFEMHYCTRSLGKTAFYDRICTSEYSAHVAFHFDDGSDAQRLDLVSALADPPAERLLYVCGPAGFLEAVRAAAARSGWPNDRVHFEYFSAVGAERSASIDFEVQIASTGAVYSIPRDKSVDEVLAEHCVEIATSCEQGICGTCITRVLKGTPDHRDLVLTDAEKASNDQFTPCCSRSLSRRLVLDL